MTEQLINGRHKPRTLKQYRESQTISTVFESRYTNKNGTSIAIDGYTMRLTLVTPEECKRINFNSVWLLSLTAIGFIFKHGLHAPKVNL